MQSQHNPPKNNGNQMKTQEYLLKHSKEFLTYLRTKVPVYHLSNIFFRDVHYAVIDFLRAEGMKVYYTSAESLTRALIDKFEKEKLLGRIDYQTWVVQNPEYRTPVRKPAAAAAPARPAAPAPALPGAAASARPAAATTTAASKPEASSAQPT
jgi:hypothetical protein